jgi:uncharacterized membrane protein YeaQ/YmgE (transglycosylase-associated protein family)
MIADIPIADEQPRAIARDKRVPDRTDRPSGGCNASLAGRCREPTRDQRGSGEASPASNRTLGWRFSTMGIIAWIVLGAIAGYLGGMIVRGDEGMGVIGHIVLGIVGALIGGFLAGALFGTNPIDRIDLGAIVVATIGAVIAVIAWNALTGRARTGRGVV